MSIQQMFLGAGGGGGESVADWFSIDDTTGNSSTQDVTNNIDLINNQGLVISKDDATGYGAVWHDTRRGAYKYLSSLATGTPNGYDSNTSAEGDSDSYGVPSWRTLSFNNDGFKLHDDQLIASVNYHTMSHKHFTFRAAPKFFDIVKYAGTGSPTTHAHTLGCDPGMIIYKRVSTAGGEWVVWHKDMVATKYLSMNYRCEIQSTTNFNSTTPTSSVFSVNSNDTNKSGSDHIAYLFAADEDYIKCGQYTSSYTSSAPGPSVNLGWEPQFVMIKQKKLGTGEAENAANAWHVFPATTTTANSTLILHSNAGVTTGNYISFTSTGFTIDPNGTTDNLGNSTMGGVNYPSNGEYIYVAIRKPD